MRHLEDLLGAPFTLAESETQRAITAWCEHRDQAAAAWLVTRYKPLIWSIAQRRMPSLSLTEDAVQDVLARMFTQMDRYQPTAAFGAWIVTITQHWCANQMRALQRQWRYLDSSLSADTLESFAREIPEPCSSPQNNFREICSLIRSTLMTFDKIDRSIFMQHCLQGVNSNEVARRIGISPGSVRVRAHRVRQALRHCRSA